MNRYISRDIQYHIRCMNCSNSDFEIRGDGCFIKNTPAEHFKSLGWYVYKDKALCPECHKEWLMKR